MSTAEDGAQDGGRLGGRLTLILLAMLWPAQLLTAAGLLTSLSQAEIAQHFHTTQIAWFSLIYTLGVTLLTPFVAKFGDMVGKKRVMLVITVIGLAGDLITAVATNYETMLIGRGLAAFYGPIAPLVFASIRDVFPRRHVGTASGAIGASTGIVLAVCPLVGGWLLDSFGFRGVLWFLTLCTAVGFFLVLAFVPETPVHAQRTRFDWAGGILLGGSAATLIYAVGKGAEWGWSDTKTIGLLVGSIAAATAFVLVERATSHPLLDVRMFTRRNAASVLTASSLGQGTVYAAGTMIVFLTLFPSIPGVSDGLGWSATHSAVVGLPAGIIVLPVGLAAGILTRRVDSRLPWMLGLLIVAAGYTAQAFYHHNEAQVIATGVLTNLGVGLVLACAPIMIVGSVSAEEQGLASAMSGMLTGLVTAVVTQVMFIALNSSSTVLNGTRFYHDAGLTRAYLTLAGAVAAALLVSLLIPRLRRPTDIEPAPLSA
ncbi:MFS transporter [Kitasatospora sp. NPDC057198]|uniref:MFS transporter n=1 Tax=Kitasatospora sp. NPDC057198 TaxID=3346046 RepID=UPI003625992F